MNKKELEQLQRQEEIINTRLLFALGFDVSEDGHLVDQDTLEQVMFMNKPLRCNQIIHFKDAKFDPIHNRKLADAILKIFLKKEEQDNDLYCKMYTENQIYKGDILTGTQLHLDTSNGLYTTDFYRSDTLKYIDAILRISGQLDSSIDFQIFDKEFMEKK